MTSRFVAPRPAPPLPLPLPRALPLALALAACAASPAAPPASSTSTTTWSYAAPASANGLAAAGSVGASPASPAPAASLLVTRVEPDAGYVWHASVWRVTSDGRASRLAFAFPDVGLQSVVGTTAPVPSRDGRRVAFVQGHALFVLDAATLSVRAVGAPAPPGHEILVAAWSRDGAEILAFVGDPRAAVPHGVLPYRLVSTATGGSVDAPLAGELVGFLPDGEAVLLGDDGLVLRRASPGARDAGGILFRSAAPLLQPALSPDGSAVVARARVSGADRVVSIDLASGAVTALGDAGHGVENPWPEYSPSGARVAWLEGPPLGANEAAERVAVAGAPAVDAGGAKIARFHFIDDDAIVLVCEGRLLVVDVATGRLRGRVDTR